MNSRHYMDTIYHGAISSDDEANLSKLDSLGLEGLTIRNAQSVMATDRNHMVFDEDSEECDAYPIPNPLNNKEANSLWIESQTNYRKQKLKPYLATPGSN